MRCPICGKKLKLIKEDNNGVVYVCEECKSEIVIRK